MKTLISCEGNSLKAAFDLRFGRASWFCLLDDKSGDTHFYKNEFKEADHGAGGKVVEKAIDMGVTRVISGDFGPKAKDLLIKFNIQMVILPDGNRSIKEIITQLK